MPICVINDPMNFNADYQAQKLKNKEAPTEVFLEALKVRSVAIGDANMRVSNLLTIAELKT